MATHFRKIIKNVKMVFQETSKSNRVYPPETKSVLNCEQREALLLIAAGYTYQGIANKLGINMSALKRLITRKKEQGYAKECILEILNAPNKTVAVVNALKTGYIVLDEINVLSCDYETEPGVDLSLTAKQTKILRHMAKGFEFKEIGQELCLAESTVKNYVCSTYMSNGIVGIYEKLGVVTSQTAAVVCALQLGYLKLEEI